MATPLLTPLEQLESDHKIHCQRCGWKGTAGEPGVRVIPNTIVLCPQCDGPCHDGHPPEKKKS